MKVFILGGEGFVGSAFVREAIACGHEVTVVTRANYSHFCGSNCDLFVNANGNSRKFFADQKPLEEFDMSVTSVLRSLLDFHCDRYLHISTVDVYPRLNSPRWNHETTRIEPEQLSRYGLHKYIGEQLVRNYAPRWLILRCGGMLGPGLWKNSVYDILNEHPLWVHINSKYQFILTEDVARLGFRLLECQPENDIFNVCGKGCVALREVAMSRSVINVRYMAEHPRMERYEVSMAKLDRLLGVPKSAEALKKFLFNSKLSP